MIWVADDVRDAVVDFVRYWPELTELPVRLSLGCGSVEQLMKNLNTEDIPMSVTSAVHGRLNALTTTLATSFGWSNNSG